MPIISVDIMKTIDEREMQKKPTKQTAKKNSSKGRKQHKEEKL